MLRPRLLHVVLLLCMLLTLPSLLQALSPCRGFQLVLARRQTVHGQLGGQRRR
jgi:hypothetical protein